MVIKSFKHLVIDTSVLCSTSEESIHPNSVKCVEFLKNALKICHHAIITEDIFQEWLKHCNSATSKWLSAMEEKDKLHYHEIETNNKLRDMIYQNFSVEQGRDAMLKDCLLIEAALVSDRIIISLDEKAKYHFQNAANDMEDIRKIVWVNPIHQNKEVIQWLRNGAKPAKKYMLGALSEDE